MSISWIKEPPSVILLLSISAPAIGNLGAALVSILVGLLYWPSSAMELTCTEPSAHLVFPPLQLTSVKTQEDTLPVPPVHLISNEA